MAGRADTAVRTRADTAVETAVGAAIETAAEAAAGLLRGRRTLALTGAGVSTDSGIPDYRGPGSPPRRPMTYAEFRSGPAARQRYWARSHVGWQRMGQAVPNPGHRALAALQRAGAVSAVVSQNVDGLHTAAGSPEVVNLHGLISQVSCLDCGDRSSRVDLHRRLEGLNPEFGDAVAASAPDGDAMVGGVEAFLVADCERCGGPLKPDVVFFGENVPKPRVERVYGLVEAAQALLVAGSSLTVLSGFRFVRHAHRLGLPVVIVNRGPTRGDELATLRVDAGCSEVLSALARRLDATS